LFVPKRINSFHVDIIRDHLSEKQGVGSTILPQAIINIGLVTNHEYQRVITQLPIM